jgi:hypothetical protein
LIPTQHFCVGDGRHLPLSSFCTRVARMYAQPAKNLYIRSLVYNRIEQLTTTTHNNQHESRHPTLHRLQLSPSMVRPAAPPTHGAAASYRLAQGARHRVRQRCCWFPRLGRQR